MARDAWPPAPAFSAATISAADAKRSAGDLRRHRSTTAATPGGIWRTRSAIGRASLSSTRATRPIGVGASNGCAPRGVFVEHHAVREDVGPRVGGLSVQLLGRHVRGRADTTPGCVATSALPPADRARSTRARPKSSTLSRPSPVAHDVLGLEVAVRDAVRVRAARALRPAREPSRQSRPRVGRCAAAISSRRVCPSMNSAAMNRCAAELFERVDRADARMGQRRPRPAPRAGGDRAARDRRVKCGGSALSATVAAEPGVGRQVDAAHAAAADLARRSCTGRPTVPGVSSACFFVEQLRPCSAQRLGQKRPRL